MRFAHVVATTAVLALGGCAAREHLGDAIGRAYHEDFSTQAPRPTTPKPAMTSGLDSQEASIIADSYRRSLAPKGERTEAQPVVLVAPPQAGAPRYLPPLAPSVPKE